MCFFVFLETRILFKAATLSVDYFNTYLIYNSTRKWHFLLVMVFISHSYTYFLHEAG